MNDFRRNLEGINKQSKRGMNILLTIALRSQNLAFLKQKSSVLMPDIKKKQANAIG